ncbi:MAG: glutamate synthase large subunit [Bacteroidetes bacterium]|nr:glutamate synthase large subunit [Bacteroidota bacterium]
MAKLSIEGMSGIKKNKSLYRSEFERDSCGIGFIANIKGIRSNSIIKDSLSMLECMEHRGGKGCELDTGDGAGIMTQIPYEFFTEVVPKSGFELKEAPEQFGVGLIYFPQDEATRKIYKLRIRDYVAARGFEIIGYRVVPVNTKFAGKTSLKISPWIEQLFVRYKEKFDDSIFLERKLFVLRKYLTQKLNQGVKHIENECYVPSFSCRRIVYKGQLRTDQLRHYFSDLTDTRLKSNFAMIHSRFSTNTFPSWQLAQPFRYLAHNGEINTIRGNVLKMRSKEALFETPYFTKDEMEILLPICNPRNSDSSNLDAMVEMLFLCGRSTPHVMTMLVPEAWQDNELMNQDKKAYYQFHASLMEPWDGPAALCFADGRMVGATLDRNGLRPGRYCLTNDDRLIVSSEAGALEVDPAIVIKKGRLEPGKMIVADLHHGKFRDDVDLKTELMNQQPYKEWVRKNRSKLRHMPIPENMPKPMSKDKVRKYQQAFGFSTEDLNVLIKPMAEGGKEPLGSMGADTPLAVLSNQNQHLSHYFKQHFAQVSNPAIDPIRERLVMAIFTRVGSNHNILTESPIHSRQIHISQPVLSLEMFEKLRQLEIKDYRVEVIDAVFKADGNKGSLEKGLDVLCKKAEIAVMDGVNILIISDKGISKSLAPIPSLMAIGAVQHHLVDNQLRSRTGLVVEAGDAAEVHHFATLVGYGASAVYPYMAFETIRQMRKDGLVEDHDEDKIFANYTKAIGNGLLKVMSKMGISTLASYQGSQIFECIGLGDEVVEKCFKGTTSRIGGLDFDDIANDILRRHRFAYDTDNPNSDKLPVGGLYQWKRNGEAHLFNPDTIHLLQLSTRKDDYTLYKRYTEKINSQSERAITLRSMFDFKKTKSIPLSEVEPAEAIFRRFATGAMSFGSISHEAHSTLAIAMNRIGGKSNSGEGGEDPIRYDRKPNGDWERSAIKQVASGRFGVSSYYLTNASELQIKIAQGAKPGEGGQLPGHKVDEWIGRVRNSTPGVGLISPPPHHDIYSIEDLAQLIFDLKNANRRARINVKLVSEAGVGTVAAGVAKAMADVILISGGDGGTGASPLSSIRHAGLPWELGLAEAHQTLVMNNLRDRIVLQTDGQLRTGRDIAIAALLGAEEWGISTAALVVEGCILMRKCHLNTCPVGIATQNEELRKLFSGDPDHVVNLFKFLAHDLREIMASLGIRTVNEMIGRSDLLEVRNDIKNSRLKKLQLESIIYRIPESDENHVYNKRKQQHDIENVLDKKLIDAARLSLESGEVSKGKFKIVNTDRAVGAMLSNEISRKYKGVGLPAGTIKFNFRGSAGQSFGAFAAPGIKFVLEGEANDYFGKGLSGGQLIVYPHRESNFLAYEQTIIGNVALYGATAGEVYVSGIAGERFGVRNSGAIAIVEGVGDHGCEYMTGGRVVILGKTGKNFAAGMSGGITYVYNPDKEFNNLCNMEMVKFEIPDFEDANFIKQLIIKHMKFTGSRLAEEILSDWGNNLIHFTKVMPTEYKAVLSKQKKLQKESV